MNIHDKKIVDTFKLNNWGQPLRFLSKVESVIRREYVLDIVSFDEMLKKKYAGEYSENESLDEFLTRTYGKETRDFIESLI